MGPMFSGKSTELIRQARRYRTIYKDRILMVNHSLNKRYGSTCVTTHDKGEWNENCVSVFSLADVHNLEVWRKASVIMIEELQFFHDAFDYVQHWVEECDKIVIAAGLDGDYKREPFGDVLKLVPYADKIQKLSAICCYCGDGTPACFTHRKQQRTNTTRVVVGAKATYTSVCRKHYRELNDDSALYINK